MEVMCSSMFEKSSEASSIRLLVRSLRKLSFLCLEIDKLFDLFTLFDIKLYTLSGFLPFGFSFI